MSGWISLKDRKPRAGKTVIVFDPDYGGVQAGEIIDGDFYEPNGDRLYHVTHWMPFPEPPSTKSDAPRS